MNKKEIILATALQLFVENGFHGTATAKIAKEAGVANGTLFLYFKTKDDLVKAIFLSIKEKLTPTIETTVAKDISIKEKFYQTLVATLSWSLANPTEFLYVQMIHNSPYFAQLDQAVIERHIVPHYNLISQGIKAKQVKAMPVDLLYCLITSQVFGLHQYLSNNNFSNKKTQTIINETFELIWEMVSIK